MCIYVYIYIYILYIYTYIYIYYIYAIMKTMWPTGYHHNGLSLCLYVCLYVHIQH